MRFLARLILNGVAIIIAAYLLPGLHVASPMAALVAGAILGFVNTIVRPVLFLLTLPLTFASLGLFVFVLNALCFALTAWLVPGFTIDGFWWALLGALLVSIVSMVLNALFVGKADRR